MDGLTTLDRGKPWFTDNYKIARNAKVYSSRPGGQHTYAVIQHDNGWWVMKMAGWVSTKAGRLLFFIKAGYKVAGRRNKITGALLPSVTMRNVTDALDEGLIEKDPSDGCWILTDRGEDAFRPDPAVITITCQKDLVEDMIAAVMGAGGHVTSVHKWRHPSGTE